MYTQRSSYFQMSSGIDWSFSGSHVLWINMSGKRYCRFIYWLRTWTQILTAPMSFYFHSQGVEHRTLSVFHTLSSGWIYHQQTVRFYLGISWYILCYSACLTLCNTVRNHSFINIAFTALGRLKTRCYNVSTYFSDVERSNVSTHYLTMIFNFVLFFSHCLIWQYSIDDRQTLQKTVNFFRCNTISHDS